MRRPFAQPDHDDARTTGNTVRNRPGTRVVFDADVILERDVSTVWHRLVDWGTHGEWIPVTCVDVDPDDPDRFTAWSGIRPLVLEDRMHARAHSFDGTSGSCTVDKLGPLLVGHAALTVTSLDPTPTAAPSTRVHWHEDVVVPRLPRVLARPVAKVAAAMFAHSLRRMAKRLP